MIEYFSHMPTEEGLYLWRDDKDSPPFHVLAIIKIFNNELMINFSPDVDQFKFVSMVGTADRLWCKVDD